jgi:hypothetical protein
MSQADRARSLVALPTPAPQLQSTTRRAASTSELLATGTESASTLRWRGGASATSPVSEYGAGPKPLPPGYHAADFAQARFIATAGSSSTYDSGSGSEAGTPSECEVPAGHDATALRITAAHTAAAQQMGHPSADERQPPFVAHGVLRARSPSAQSGIVSSEPDVTLLNSLFDVLAPTAADAARAASPNIPRTAGKPPAASPRAQRRASLNPTSTPAAAAAAAAAKAAPHHPSLPSPLLMPPIVHVGTVPYLAPDHMADDLRGLTVAPRTVAIHPDGYTLVDEATALKYFGGSGVAPGLAPAQGVLMAVGGPGGGDSSSSLQMYVPAPSPGPSILSPLFATTPSAGAYAQPLFSPTGTAAAPPYSPLGGH